MTPHAPPAAPPADPPPSPATGHVPVGSPPPTAEQYARLNDRRIDLIDKKYAGGLTADEAAELDRLDDVCYKHISDTVQERPTVGLDRIEALKAELGFRR